MGTSALSSNHKSTSEGPEALKRGTHIADMPHKTLAKFGVDSWINDVTMSIPINAEQNARRHFALRGENPSIESSSRTMTCNHSQSLEGTYPVAPQWGGTRRPLERSCHCSAGGMWESIETQLFFTKSHARSILCLYVARCNNNKKVILCLMQGSR